MNSEKYDHFLGMNSEKYDQTTGTLPPTLFGLSYLSNGKKLHDLTVINHYLDLSSDLRL